MPNQGLNPRVAFFVYPSAFQAQGGGEVQLLKTKEYLEKVGVEVKLFDTWKDKVQDFDILHVFGSVKDCLPMMETTRQRKVKIALSTICWYSWKSAMGTYGNLLSKSLAISRQVAKEIAPFLPSRRKRMMQISDLLLPNSQSEAYQLQRYFGALPSKTHIIPNGVDESFADADPSLFLRNYPNLDGCVLCVGRIEPRKNQLNMVRALRGTDIPFAIVGDPVPQYQDYYNLCRKEATSNIHFLGRFPNEAGLLKSAYSACKVFLLASWLETPGLAALEAGLAGARVVITPEGATREYFSTYVIYADPASPRDILRRVRESLLLPRSNDLRQHLLTNFTWRHVAEKTLSAYRSVICQA